MNISFFGLSLQEEGEDDGRMLRMGKRLLRSLALAFGCISAASLVCVPLLKELYKSKEKKNKKFEFVLLFKHSFITFSSSIAGIYRHPKSD